MFTVSRDFNFCYAHRLLGYAGRCAHLHGHNGVVRVTLQSEDTDELGMVVDFAEIKRQLGNWIDSELDHKLLLSQSDPLLDVLRVAGEPVNVMQSNPTAENIARLIYEKAVIFGFPVHSVTLWETKNCFATYSPYANYNG
ncbi:MAG: 6-carboxytetrahydropterin synthase [Planctomycetaceae bacterium]|jgi:6-pyruvoyltetrahydropterin/6-carboxytetrahydropterin synthase|nr:6-carboxytetrahydropterin synthase [Planctomycetaceae bacterium]